MKKVLFLLELFSSRNCTAHTCTMYPRLFCEAKFFYNIEIFKIWHSKSDFIIAATAKLIRFEQKDQIFDQTECVGSSLKVRAIESCYNITTLA